MLYYIPERIVSNEALNKYGLCHLINLPVEQREIRGAGPGGESGVVFCFDGTTPGEMGYYPDTQTWHAMPGGGWIGWTERPTPQSLVKERNDVQHTLPLVLGDGREWYIPVIQRTSEQTGIQRALDGNLGWSPEQNALVIVARENQRGYYEAAAALFDWVVSQEQTEFEALLKNIASCMSALYRIGYPELVALQLCSVKNIEQIVYRLLDLSGLFEKKNILIDGSDTTSGETG